MKSICGLHAGPFADRYANAQGPPTVYLGGLRACSGVPLMRWTPWILLLSLAAGPIWAADNRARPRAPTEEAISDAARAATANAVKKLFDEVAHQPLTADLTVGKYLKQIEGEAEFTKALQRADQIGGPRWVNNTCQVELEIPAIRVSYTLRQLATAHPRSSSLTPQQIERAIERWPQRAVGATGSSAVAGGLSEIRPRVGQRWAGVSEEARKKALEAANQSAAKRAIESVSLVTLTDSKTIGDGLAVPTVTQRVQAWLASRPVSNVDFRDDLEVEVTLAVDEHDFFDVMRSALSAQQDVAVPKEDQEWDRLERDFGAKLKPAVGRAKATLEKPAAPPKHAFEIPKKAPDWVNTPIDVVGESKGGDSKLKLRYARLADADAKSKLQSKIGSLKLDKDLTVDEAARQDPRVADAVARTIGRSLLYKTEYRSDGSVAVHVQADMRLFWDELRR